MTEKERAARSASNQLAEEAHRERTPDGDPLFPSSLGGENKDGANAVHLDSGVTREGDVLHAKMLYLGVAKVAVETKEEGGSHREIVMHHQFNGAAQQDLAGNREVGLGGDLAGPACNTTASASKSL